MVFKERHPFRDIITLTTGYFIRFVLCLNEIYGFGSLIKTNNLFLVETTMESFRTLHWESKYYFLTEMYLTGENVSIVGDTTEFSIETVHFDFLMRFQKFHFGSFLSWVWAWICLISYFDIFRLPGNGWSHSLYRKLRIHMNYCITTLFVMAIMHSTASQVLLFCC